MAGNLSEHYRAIMKRAITAILKNDIYELKNAFLSFGKATQKIDHASLYTDLDDMVGKYMNMDFGTMDLGELMEDALDLLKKHKIAIDSDISKKYGNDGRNLKTLFTTSKYDQDFDIIYVCEHDK